MLRNLLFCRGRGKKNIEPNKTPNRTTPPPSPNNRRTGGFDPSSSNAPILIEKTHRRSSTAWKCLKTAPAAQLSPEPGRERRFTAVTTPPSELCFPAPTAPFRNGDFRRVHRWHWMHGEESGPCGQGAHGAGERGAGRRVSFPAVLLGAGTPALGRMGFSSAITHLRPFQSIAACFLERQRRRFLLHFPARVAVRLCRTVPVTDGRAAEAQTEPRMWGRAASRRGGGATRRVPKGRTSQRDDTDGNN